MKVTLVQTIATAVVAIFLATSLVPAQVPPPPGAQVPPPPPPGGQFPPPPVGPAALQFTPQQLDQMLAPIALYPDPLLGQILMASTYPLELVQADRWLQDPQNAALKGDQLAAALAPQPWDPSVKSLVPFPQILRMLDSNLNWTESVGEAFLANQPAVMESIQRLRQMAAAAGKLRSSPQQVVTSEGQVIIIEPASPEIVYVPVYEPAVVYGLWPYPEFPPYYFPGYFDGVMIDGFGWFGVAIVLPLWGWHHWDWVHHRIDIDRDRFTVLNRNHPPAGTGAWEHEPFHRRDVPYRNPETRARFAPSGEAPEVHRGVRGFPAAPAEHVAAPPAEHMPQTFESYGRGGDVRAQSERGYNSRMSTPSFPSRGGGGGGRGHR